MKRLSSSDSVGGGGLASLCPTNICSSSLSDLSINLVISTDEESPRRYGRESEEEEEEEERAQSGVPEKKRRLSINQVKALEKNFESEKRLEAERKVKLAQELGLQPRQVAVWFQNRRARYKTKQLEKDYSVLKTQYDSLRHSFDSLRRDNESLLQEIRKLKAKLNGEEEEEKITQLPPSPPQLLEHYRSFTDLLPLEAAAGSSDSSDSSCSNLTLDPVTLPGGNFFKFVKVEQSDDFLSGEEACEFFSDWYSTVEDVWFSFTHQA